MQQDWVKDPRFAHNPDRVQHREELVPLMQAVFYSKTRDEWIALFEQAGVPCGAINNIAEALNLPQTQHRLMVVDFSEQGSQVRALGNPIHLSETPVQYKSAPPSIGQHTDEVLGQFFNAQQLAELKQEGVV
jgi:formyl-CoA transferase